MIEWDREARIMANLKYKTRGGSNPQGKPRVYFCCHSEDFKKYFETVSDEILAKQNCAIWYTDEAVAYDEDFFADLRQMQLFVMPVTANLRLKPRSPCRKTKRNRKHTPLRELVGSIKEGIRIQNST